MCSSVSHRFVQCSIGSGGETNYPAKLQPSSFSTVKFRSDSPNDHASSGECGNFVAPNPLDKVISIIDVIIIYTNDL
jgi:hypothetical protein